MAWCLTCDCCWRLSCFLWCLYLQEWRLLLTEFSSFILCCSRSCQGFYRFMWNWVCSMDLCEASWSALMQNHGNIFIILLSTFPQVKVQGTGTLCSRSNPFFRSKGRLEVQSFPDWRQLPWPIHLHCPFYWNSIFSKAHRSIWSHRNIYSSNRSYPGVKLSALHWGWQKLGGN